MQNNYVVLFMCVCITIKTGKEIGVTPYLEKRNKLF